MVGYTGGENEAATYQSVCRGDGHTEGIRLWYDEDEITYGELLAKFFKEHDVSESLSTGLCTVQHSPGH